MWFSSKTIRFGIVDLTGVLGKVELPGVLAVVDMGQNGALAAAWCTFGTIAKLYWKPAHQSKCALAAAWCTSTKSPRSSIVRSALESQGCPKAGGDFERFRRES